MPSLGEVNLLVVPIVFPEDDEFPFDEKMASSLKDFFFGNNGTLPSVKDFYEQSSQENLILNGVVSPIITLEQSRDAAASVIYSQGVDAYLSSLTNYVYNYLFTASTRTYDPAMFDGDGNGKIDGLVLVNPLWSSMFVDYGDNSANALASDYTRFSNTYSAPVDSMTYISYFDSLLPAVYLMQAGIPYYQDSDTHFFINAIGAMMGLESYYDFTGTSMGTYRAPLAMTDRMDGYIGDHNPFSKYQLGWLAPKEMITPASVSEEGTTITVHKNELVLLSYDDVDLYGEYLILDLYTPTGLDAADAKYPYIYGRSTFSKAGIRLYEVDSTLVREENGLYLPYSGTPDYESTYVASNGSSKEYGYYYRHSNEGVNPLSSYGIIDSEPLLSLLSKNGSNRHLTDMNVALTDDDLFHQGDSFTGNGVPGFYEGFTFDSGKELGLTFTVDSLSNDGATITIRRA